MDRIRPWLILVGVFLLQFFLSELLAIQYYRPDFVVIFILYFGIFFGSYYGIIAGFIIGIFIDLTPLASYFGLSSMTYSITGYLAGHLQDKYIRWSPFAFHIAWLCIIAFHFFLFTYVRYQLLFEVDLLQYLLRWFLTMTYTLIFLLILQFFFPVKRIQGA